MIHSLHFMNKIWFRIPCCRWQWIYGVTSTYDPNIKCRARFSKIQLLPTTKTCSMQARTAFWDLGSNAQMFTRRKESSLLSHDLSKDHISLRCFVQFYEATRVILYELYILYSFYKNICCYCLNIIEYFKFIVEVKYIMNFLL